MVFKKAYEQARKKIPDGDTPSNRAAKDRPRKSPRGANEKGRAILQTRIASIFRFYAKQVGKERRHLPAYKPPLFD